MKTKVETAELIPYKTIGTAPVMCVTPCPYYMQGYIQVGSNGCKRCPFFIAYDNVENVKKGVYCSSNNNI
jgi:hypothetical protein